MRQSQFMSRCSHNMIAKRAFSYWCLTLLVVGIFLVADVNGNLFAQRRQALKNVKKNVEETTESAAAIPDQIALAATENQRRKDNYEQNLVRSEKEPRLHAQITAKYTTRITADKSTPSSLEDGETAEEYVSKAVQRFGSRLKEPIRIEADTEKPPPNNVEQHYSPYSAFDKNNGAYYDSVTNVEQSPRTQQIFDQNQQSIADDETRAFLESQEKSNQQHQLQLQQQQDQQAQIANHANEQQNRFDQLLSSPENDQQNVYRTYEDESTFDGSQPIERTYRTKQPYQASYRSSSSDSLADNEKIRVSASTEIPKAEIMKQIEKSVIKYMQELEAEGKIITAPKESKSYYKPVTFSGEDKRISTTTSRPKYLTSVSSSNYHGTTSPAPYEKPSRYIAPKILHKQPSRSESSASYQSTPNLKKETAENFGPNVEFVYKIKTRAPLQTATVKTVSKPYSLPPKSSGSHFDHSAVLKNLEEFDLSHVVTTKDPEERSPSTNRPTKLYFNSEIHQDINSLPYKADKALLIAAEYQKQQEAQLQPDYKGYSGYFAEPAPIDTERETESDDGYPIMNPYQYVLKKELIPSKYEDVEVRSPTKALYSTINSQKALEYENSFGPKYSSNIDGYGHLPLYKAERDRDPIHVIHKHAQRHAPGKRGKRGGNHNSHSNKKVIHRNASKDIEASLALRPPPKV